MQIYLMQHGACLTKELDPSQPLSPVGKDQVATSALAVKKMGLWFDAVISSPKKRAMQTAEAVALRIGFETKYMLKTDAFKAMASPRDGLEYLRGLNGVKRAFIAGHMPNIANLACRLLGADVSINVENSGLMCLDTESLTHGSGTLLFYLPPFQLKMIADG